MSITEKIRQIRHLREQKNLAIRAEYENTRPSRHDLGEIPQLYERFKEIASPNYRDNVKIFILIVFYMYSPVSLLNKCVRTGGVRREIAKVLGLSGNVVTMYFGDAKSLLFNHKGFRDEAERVYKALNG